MPQYQDNEQSHHTTTNTSAPPTSEMPQYRRASDHIAGPPITTTYAQYPPLQFATPQIPHQYSNFSGHFAEQSYQNPYQHGTQQHTSSHDQATPRTTFTPVPSQPQHFLPMSSNEHSTEEGDNGEGGVPLPPSY